MKQFNDYETMAYADSGNRPCRSAGDDYLLSASYATSQLPLIAPDHPDVVQSDSSSGYDHMGTYSTPRFSVAVLVPAKKIFDNRPILTVLENLRKSDAGQKIAWRSLEERRNKLHATVSGGLEQRTNEEDLEEYVWSQLSGIEPFSVRLFGPWFFGPKNGRLYLPMVAERTRGQYSDPLREMQRVLGQAVPHAGFYVGFLNLVDHLLLSEQSGRHEADSLFSVLTDFDRQPLAELEVDEVAILRTHDDLILDSSIVATVPLTR